jgi:hypothetical protein
MSTIDDRVFECEECGHIERGQDADDCRYHGIVHWLCECKDCDFEDCDACEAAGCEEFECCHECEAKYDELEAKRQHAMTLKAMTLKEERRAKAANPPEEDAYHCCECEIDLSKDDEKFWCTSRDRMLCGDCLDKVEKCYNEGCDACDVGDKEDDLMRLLEKSMKEPTPEPIAAESDIKEEDMPRLLALVEKLAHKAAQRKIAAMAAAAAAGLD